jgi:hypothetical protein
MAEPIAQVSLQNKRLLYSALFSSAWESLRGIAADPKHLGADIRALVVLHMWGQTLAYHPHVHCVIPGGCVSPDGARWIAGRKRFFLPVRVPSRRFRTLFVRGLRAAPMPVRASHSTTRSGTWPTRGLRGAPSSGRNE